MRLLDCFIIIAHTNMSKNNSVGHLDIGRIENFLHILLRMDLRFSSYEGGRKERWIVEEIPAHRLYCFLKCCCCCSLGLKLYFLLLFIRLEALLPVAVVVC